MDCTEAGITAFLAAVKAAPPGVDSAHAAIRTLSEAVERPCFGTGAPDGAQLEMASRRQAVAAVALPWIVGTLDIHGSSSPGMARDALALLLVVSWYRHTDCEDEHEDEEEGVLTQLANSIGRMLDAHARDAGVVEAGLALLAELARNEWGNVTSQVRGCEMSPCPPRMRCF